MSSLSLFLSFPAFLSSYSFILSHSSLTTPFYYMAHRMKHLTSEFEFLPSGNPGKHTCKKEAGIWQRELGKEEEAGGREEILLLSCLVLLFGLTVLFFLFLFLPFCFFFVLVFIPHPPPPHHVFLRPGILHSCIRCLMHVLSFIRPTIDATALEEWLEEQAQEE